MGKLRLREVKEIVNYSPPSKWQGPVFEPKALGSFCYTKLLPGGQEVGLGSTGFNSVPSWRPWKNPWSAL